jgi:hypothetical protein
LLLVAIGAFLCADLGAGAARAQETPGTTDPGQAGESVGTASSEAQGDANAAIAQRLLRGAQKPRCGVPGPDGSIVVCGGREANDKERLPLRDDLESAHSTKDGLPRAPNISGLPDCSRGCIGFGGVPAPMYYFDITKLPEAPPDSDADKIARGEIRAP